MGCGSSDVRGYKEIDSTIWRGNLKIELKKAVFKEEVQLIGKSVIKNLFIHYKY